MGGKTTVALGLVSGLLVGGLAIGAVIALTPGPTAPAPVVETPSGNPATASAPPSPEASLDASPSPAAATGEPGASTLAEAFGVGELAPPLELPLVGGETVNLTDYRGKPVWVNFMATWCPPCVDELPRMAGFLARYEDTGLVILAVDVGEDEATVQAFFQDLEIYFPTALDADGRAQDAWGALALPVHFWVDGEGIVRDGALGGIGPDVMAERLQTILPDVEVTP